MADRVCIRCGGEVPEHFAPDLEVCVNCRISDVTAVEEENEEHWWYLSFADGKFLGACIVRAHGVVSASQRAWELGINPGGQVLGHIVPEGNEDLLPRNCLLTEDDVKSIMTKDELSALDERRENHASRSQTPQ